MGAAAFTICFSFLILYWDIVYRLRMVLSIPGARRKCKVHAPRMARMAFALSRLYRNHRIYLYKDKLKDLPEVFLLIVNHQSIVDIPVLIRFIPDRPLRFVAKSSLFRGAPLFSVLLRLQRHGAIDRKGRLTKTMVELDRLALGSRKGLCPVIFPEGTRSRDGVLGAFHSGAVKRIMDTASIDVVTVAMDGGWLVSDAGQLVAGLKNCIYRVKIVDIRKPPQSRQEAGKLLQRSHTLIQKQLDEWHGNSIKKK